MFSMMRNRRSRLFGTLLAAGTLATMGTVVAAGPAYADQPGEWCTILSSGKVTLDRSSIHYGDSVTVHWDLRMVECPAPIWYIDGPGFGSAIPITGDRQVTGITGTTTWTLYLYDTEVDMPVARPVASATVFVN
jgi:hypothetical protein